jgi:D-serine deaminase-like pyridoxal phosphate-dependent protein
MIFPLAHRPAAVDPADLQTPCLVVDRDVLEGNLVAMANPARHHGLSLRQHAKTHKCLEIARGQVALGAVGLTVATLGEAEVFAEAGFTDLFIAYSLWVAGARGRRLCALADRVALRVGADSAEGVEVLARALKGTEVEIAVEIDSGHHRTGVAPKRAGAAARRLRTAMGCAWLGCLTSRGTATSPAAGSRRQRMRRAHAGGGCCAEQARAGGPARRRIDADRGAGDPRGAERDATRRVRLQRRPAGRARGSRLGCCRTHGGGHGREPARPLHRPRRREQSAGS